MPNPEKVICPICKQDLNESPRRGYRNKDCPQCGQGLPNPEKKTVDEILGELVEKCYLCEGGDCVNCGQKSLNIEQAKLQLKQLAVGLSEKEIAQILLDTCEKELNQTIGFMLTDKEAEMFAQAIHSAQQAANEKVWG